MTLPLSEMVSQQLLDAVESVRDGCGQAARAQIERALAIMRSSRELTTSSGVLPEWRARKVKQYIETRLEYPIRVSELARLVGLSPGHFCRQFHQRFGLPPRDYVMLQRMDLAKRHMLSTPEPLCSIALQCGLADQSHFSRVFRRVVGMSPYQWRRSQSGPAQDASPMIPQEAPTPVSALETQHFSYPSIRDRKARIRSSSCP